jgi:hypothetical protein
MDANRFDEMTRDFQPRSRRCFLGFVTGIGGLLVIATGSAASKCKKVCGTCKRCKKGKCKPKPDGTVCEGGTCSIGRCVLSTPAPACASVGQSCATLACCDGFCGDAICRSAPCQQVGFQCEGASDCCSGACDVTLPEPSYCVTCLGTGVPCGPGNDLCCPGLTCSAGSCQL